MRPPFVQLTARLTLDNGQLWFRGKLVDEPGMIGCLDRQGESKALTGDTITHYTVRGTRHRLRRIAGADGSSVWDTGSATIPQVVKSFKKLEEDRAMRTTVRGGSR